MMYHTVFSQCCKKPLYIHYVLLPTLSLRRPSEIKPSAHTISAHDAVYYPLVRPLDFSCDKGFN